MNKHNFLSMIISLLPGLKPNEKIILLNRFDNENDFIMQTKKDIEEIVNKNIINFWNIDDIRSKAEKIISLCAMKGINWVSWNESEYPPLLRTIYDPPPVLYFRGNLPNPEKCLLGIVGTRKPTAGAAMQAFIIARDLAREGISVVSGLALGIDAMAHRGNLSAPGVPGFAVLGCGADQIYPSSNKNLARQILNSGGALISEYPPLTRPFKSNFPARNRIISALSRSVLIVQAPKKSGALITADFAANSGRDVWVASSGLKNENEEEKLLQNEGTIKLAEDGADVINSVRDIFEKWNIEFHSVKCADNSGSSLAHSMANLLEIEL